MEKAQKQMNVQIAKKYSNRKTESFGNQSEKKKIPKSLYKNKHYHEILKLSPEAMNLSQVDLFRESSIVYPQETFSRDDIFDPDKDSFEKRSFDRLSIISSSDEYYSHVRPFGYFQQKPRALYKNSEFLAKFYVNDKSSKENFSQNQANIESQNRAINQLSKPPVFKKIKNQTRLIDQAIQTQTSKKDQSTQQHQTQDDEIKVESILKLDSNQNKQELTIDKEKQNKSKSEDAVATISPVLFTKEKSNIHKNVNTTPDQIHPVSAGSNQFFFSDLFDLKSLNKQYRLEKRKLIEQKLRLHYPAKFAIGESIVILISSLAQIALQIVLLCYNTPLNFVSAGIWSGLVGIAVLTSNILTVIKRSYNIYNASLILNYIGIVVFIILAIINSVCLSLYSSCDSCSYYTKMLGINVVLMVCAVVSFSFCIIFLMKIRFEMS